MKITVNKKLTLAGFDEKSSVNLYTLLDENFDKIIAIGGKFKDLVPMSKYDVELTIRTSSERFEVSTGERKYLEVANIFISRMDLVK